MAGVPSGQVPTVYLGGEFAGNEYRNSETRCSNRWLNRSDRFALFSRDVALSANKRGGKKHFDAGANFNAGQLDIPHNRK